MDVRTTKCVLLWPRWWEKLFDLWHLGRRGQECPQGIRTKTFMLCGLSSLTSFSSKTKGPGEEGAAGYCPKILLPKGPKWCSVLSIGVIGKSALIGHIIVKGGDLNPGERHSRDTRDDNTVTLCTLRAATVLSRACRADFGRPLTKKVMCTRVTVRVSRHHCRQTLYLSPGCGIPPPHCVTPPPLKKSPIHRSQREICTRNRPLSETKILDDFWVPLPLPAPLFYC